MEITVVLGCFCRSASSRSDHQFKFQDTGTDRWFRAVEVRGLVPFARERPLPRSLSTEREQLGSVDSAVTSKQMRLILPFPRSDRNIFLIDHSLLS